MNWIERLLKTALKQQDRIRDRVINKVPIDVRLEGKGRKARLAITGEPSAIFFLKWDGQRLIEEETSQGVRNNVQLHVDTLLDIASGELGLRDAIAAGLVTVEGDRSLYDSEEILGIFEDFLHAELGSLVEGKKIV